MTLFRFSSLWISFVLAISGLVAQVQIGQSIPSENGGDIFGALVAISGNGTVESSGAWGNDGNGADAGHVNVFSSSGSTCVQLRDGEMIDCRGQICSPRLMAPCRTDTVGIIHYEYNNGIYLYPADMAVDSSAGYTLSIRRLQSCIDFDWTTQGACIDQLPNGTINSNDLGLIFKPCLPVAFCDTIIHFEVKLVDGMGNTTYCTDSLIIYEEIDTMPDYEISTLGDSLVVTDLIGHGDIMGVTQHASGLRIEVPGRTHRFDNGIVDLFPLDISLLGITSITINAKVGNDIINVGAFNFSLPELIINAGSGDDQVNFNGDLTFSDNAGLNVDLQNDDTIPGVDQVLVQSNANLIFSGSGSAFIMVSRNITLNSGASIQTEHGDLMLEANQQNVPTVGTFYGVSLNGGLAKVTESGQLTVIGKGGNSGSFNAGVYINTVLGKIEGGTSGTLLLDGTGGGTVNQNNSGVLLNNNASIRSYGCNIDIFGSALYGPGVYVLGQSTIVSVDTGYIHIEGIGNGTISANNYGVYIRDNSSITLDDGDIFIQGFGGGTGNAINGVGVGMHSSVIFISGDGTVQINGTAGPASGNGHQGVYIVLSSITTSYGDIFVTGQGGGSGTANSNYGVTLYNTVALNAGGPGSVYIEGIGGNGSGYDNIGVLLFSGSGVSTSNGDININGEGGGLGTSVSNFGVAVHTNSTIVAGGPGDVMINGTGGGLLGNNNIGVLVYSNSIINSSGGNVEVVGYGGATSGANASLYNDGIFVQAVSTVSAGGTGNVRVVGIPGGDVGIENIGVVVISDSKITSSGGNLEVEGAESALGVGIATSLGGSITTALNGGNISIRANSLKLSAPIHAGSNNVLHIFPLTDSLSVNLGASTDPIGGPLSLSSSELSYIESDTVIIGNDLTTNIQVSSDLTLSGAQYTILRCIEGVVMNPNVTFTIQGFLEIKEE